jgi:hypothetical protein
MGHKILHRKQKYKQWATKYYTENKNINNGPHNTTQKTKNINNGSQNTTQKNKKYKQWATQYYTKQKI